MMGNIIFKKETTNVRSYLPMWISDQWTVAVSVLVTTTDIAMTILHISVMSKRKQPPQKIKTDEEAKKNR